MKFLATTLCVVCRRLVAKTDESDPNWVHAGSDPVDHDPEINHSQVVTREGL